MCRAEEWARKFNDAQLAERKRAEFALRLLEWIEKHDPTMLQQLPLLMLPKRKPE
jgi:hypothetical protein